MTDDPLDQTGLIADPFYELKDPLGKDASSGYAILAPGQLVRAHVVIPSAKPQVLEPKNYDPRNEAATTFVVANARISGAPVSHFPIKELNLQNDEVLYVVRGKVRPAVVLQTITTDFFSRQVPEPYALIAPCFSFKLKHTPKYRAQIAAMKFPNLFYLPAHVHGLADQGVLRLELIQPVATGALVPFLTVGKKQQFLTLDSWTILQHRLVKLLTKRILDEELDKTLDEYGDIVMDAYRQT